MSSQRACRNLRCFLVARVSTVSSAALMALREVVDRVVELGGIAQPDETVSNRAARGRDHSANKLCVRRQRDRIVQTQSPDNGRVGFRAEKSISWDAVGNLKFGDIIVT